MTMRFAPCPDGWRCITDATAEAAEVVLEIDKG